MKKETYRKIAIISAYVAAGGAVSTQVFKNHKDSELYKAVGWLGIIAMPIAVISAIKYIGMASSENMIEIKK